MERRRDDEARGFAIVVTRRERTPANPHVSRPGSPQGRSAPRVSRAVHASVNGRMWNQGWFVNPDLTNAADGRMYGEEGKPAMLRCGNGNPSVICGGWSDSAPNRPM